MALQKVVGVDFSGEEGDDKKGKTWATTGHFDGSNLTLVDCNPISRDDLEKLLMNLPNCAVASIDFPFSVH